MTRHRIRSRPFHLLPLLIVLISLLFCGTTFSLNLGGGAEADPVLEVVSGPFSSPVGISPVLARREVSSLIITDSTQQTLSLADPANPDEVEELLRLDGMPLGLATYRRLIYVGNRSAGSVDIYFRVGKMVRLLRRIKTSTPMQPNDLAIDSRARRLFVADGLANDVKVFTLFGRLVRTIDGFGDLFNPQGVAISPQDRVVAVTDSGNLKLSMPASVQLYDYSGTQIMHKTGDFSAPRGVALSSDRMFVADAVLGQVLVLNRANGGLLGTFGSFGTGPGQLLMPLDLTYDGRSETLYVVNNRMGRIETFVPADFQPVEVSP